MIKIREATQKDIPVIAAVHSASNIFMKRQFMLESELGDDPVERYEKSWIKSLQKDQYKTALLCEINETVVGFTVFKPEEDEGLNAMLYALYTHPDYIGMGVGTVLINEVERLLSDIGSTKVILFTPEENDIGRQFYETKGYVSNDKKFIDVVNEEEPPFKLVGYEKKLKP